MNSVPEKDEDVLAEDAISLSVPEEGVEEESAATTIKEQSHVSIQPLTIHQLKPPLSEKFKENPIKGIINSVIEGTLNEKEYNSANAKTWTISMANEINKQIKGLNMKRYKHVVQVIIGELKGAGVKCGVRCIWDSETDGYTYIKYINDSLFCVIVVFAVYLY